MLRTILVVTAILSALTGCGPTPESTNRSNGLHFVQLAGRPEVTSEKIAGDLVGKKIATPELNGDGPEDEWTFEANEFRQVDILEKQTTDTGLTLVIFLTTRSNPVPEEVQVQVSGKLHLQYEWKDSKWVLTAIKNLNFRYSVGVPT